MKKVKRFLSFEAIAANFAVILSLCAIVISFVEVSSIREQKHAEVWPRVYLSTNSNSLEKQFSLQIHNKGVGPAIIKNMKLKADGKQVTTWHDALEAVVGQQLNSYKGSKSRITNATITQGESLRILSLRGQMALEMMKNKSLDYKICYCSIFARCWTVENSSEFGFPEPTPVDECTVNKSVQFRE